MPEAAIPDAKKFAGLKRREPVSDLDHVYDELKRSMMAGEFVPGQKLKLAELAAAFGTSHMPVREALNRLAVVHALDTAPRRSPSVPQANIKRLRDILSLRVDLECKAARLALENDTGSLAKAIKTINDRMNAECDRREPSIRRYLELNQKFHFEIYQRSGNDDLLTLIELLWMRYGPMLNLISADGGLSLEHSLHGDIIEAVEQNDAARLQDALSQDLSSAADAIERRIRQIEAG